MNALVAKILIIAFIIGTWLFFLAYIEQTDQIIERYREEVESLKLDKEMLKHRLSSMYGMHVYFKKKEITNEQQ